MSLVCNHSKQNTSTKIELCEEHLLIYFLIYYSRAILLSSPTADNKPRGTNILGPQLASPRLIGGSYGATGSFPKYYSSFCSK